MDRSRTEQGLAPGRRARRQRGRRPNGPYTLTPEQRATIRDRYARGLATQAALAREYGISPQAVSRLVNWGLM